MTAELDMNLFKQSQKTFFTPDALRVPLPAMGEGPAKSGGYPQNTPGVVKNCQFFIAHSSAFLQVSFVILVVITGFGPPFEALIASFGE